MSGGTVEKKVKGSGPLEEARLRRYLSDALRGLQYLHGKNVRHYDIKPGNMLLDEDENDRVMLTDFGLSRAGLDNTDNPGGTPSYKAPELVNGTGDHGPGTDIWALACSVIYMATGKNPWNTKAAVEVRPTVEPTVAGGDSDESSSSVVEESTNKNIKKKASASVEASIRAGGGDSDERNSSVVAESTKPEVSAYVEATPTVARGTPPQTWDERRDQQLRAQKHPPLRHNGVLLPGISPILEDLLLKMLHPDPKQRYPAPNCLCHAFFVTGAPVTRTVTAHVVGSGEDESTSSKVSESSDH